MKKQTIFCAAVSAAIALFIVSCSDKAPNTPDDLQVMSFQAGLFPYPTYTCAQTYIESANPVSIFTSSTLLTIGCNAFDSTRALLSFDVSALTPPNVQVVKAYLTLYASGWSASMPTLQAYKMSALWTPYSPSWRFLDIAPPMTSWTTRGGDYYPTPVSDAVQFSDSSNSLTLTLDNAMVQDWIAKSEVNYGILIKSQNETSHVNGELRIFSSRYAAPYLRPKLTIYYRLP
jgi:hypothetical protein